MKSLSVRAILFAVVGALGILAVLLAGTIAYDMSERRNVAEISKEYNEIGDMLLAAAGGWALERGLSMTAFNADAPVDAETRARIRERRVAADSELAAALERISASGDTGIHGLSETKASFARVEALRRDVDAGLALAKGQRKADLGTQWLGAITGLIESTQALRRALELSLETAEARLANFQMMKDAIWVMSEYAGRERAALGAAISRGGALDAQALQSLAANRGRVEYAWETVRTVTLNTSVSPEITNAVEAVRAEFFGTLAGIRQSVIEAGARGSAYPVSADAWVGDATRGIDAILELGRITGEEIDGLAASAARDATQSMIFGLAVLLAAALISAAAFWLIVSRVMRPLEAIRSTMSQLAEGDKAVTVPGLDRKDEIGAMAAAVEVFRKNAEEIDRLEAEQVERDRLTAEEKRRMMNELADSFLASVGGVVDMVSSAATEMESTAQSMTGTADETNRRAVAVSAASEEASTNVNSVASAADELSSSIGEIARQVQHAAGIAAGAVASADATNRTVEGLAATAQKIGEVVDLINTIAEQTNLLALNATIEAARAGDAGKGFAVVAQEVKALASQTSKATEEIGQQISGIQSATAEAVKAIREIGGTIVSINEISSAIASAVEEQGAATEEIARNVQQASSGTGEVSANITGVSSAASETGTAATQVLGAARDLAQQAERLRQEVDGFVERVRAA